MKDFSKLSLRQVYDYAFTVINKNKKEALRAFKFIIDNLQAVEEKNTAEKLDGQDLVYVYYNLIFLQLNLFLEEPGNVKELNNSINYYNTFIGYIEKAEKDIKNYNLHADFKYFPMLPFLMDAKLALAYYHYAIKVVKEGSDKNKNLLLAQQYAKEAVTKLPQERDNIQGYIMAIKNIINHQANQYEEQADQQFDLATIIITEEEEQNIETRLKNYKEALYLYKIAEGFAKFENKYEIFSSVLHVLEQITMLLHENKRKNEAIIYFKEIISHYEQADPKPKLDKTEQLILDRAYKAWKKKEPSYLEEVRQGKREETDLPFRKRPSAFFQFEPAVANKKAKIENNHITVSNPKYCFT